MDTSRSIKKRVEQANSRVDPIIEETIVVSQMQNLVKQRVLEAILVGIPSTTARRFILPRFGFVIRKGLQGGLLDLLFPSSYFYYFINKDRQALAKIVGIQDDQRIDKDTQLARTRYVNQFWSNSQYWH